MVGHTFLFNDAVRWVKDYIDRDELGEVYYAYFQRLNLGRVRQDVDALWNLAPHDVSIAQYWFGEKPVSVEAHGASFLQPGIDDISFLSMQFSQRALRPCSCELDRSLQDPAGGHRGQQEDGSVRRHLIPTCESSSTTKE